MTAKEFYDKHKGKVIDIDSSPKGDIYQCVDLFKAFTKENYNVYNYNTTNGYACGLWIYRHNKPYYKYFKDADVKSLQNGDWVFWGFCKVAPKSHVAMYYNGKFFGQNQNGKKQATLINISKDGIIGVLRPKMYIKNNTSNISYYKAYKGNSGSIVDALKAIGADSSFNNRRAIAKANGITGYIGTPAQNTKMLNLLKQGKLIKRL